MVATLLAPPSRSSRWSACSRMTGRFLADALGVAPDVAVEHQVADDQHARLAEALHQFDQVGGHPCLRFLAPEGRQLIARGVSPWREDEWVQAPEGDAVS